MSRRVTNTTKAIGDSPILGLALLMGGAGEGIEAMEAAGQRELVQADQIPTSLTGIDEAGLVTLGFRLGEPARDDPIFRDAVLPIGWAKVPTDHATWSRIVDEKGRRRFSIFYKASFYDRRSRMDAERRYGYSTYADGSEPGLYAAVIRDGDEVIERVGERRSADHREGDRLDASCREWLRTRYPDWEDPLAYWD
jgi:hypothetical protein